MRNAGKLKQSLHTGCRQNTAGAQAASLRDTGDLGAHHKAASHAGENFPEAPPFHGKDPAGKKSRFLQGKRIVRIPCLLQRFDLIKLTVNVHIPAVKNDLKLPDLFQRHLHRAFSVKEYGRIQNGTPFFIAVGRRIAPAASPIYTQRKRNPVPVHHNTAGFVYLQILQSSAQHRLPDTLKAGPNLLVTGIASKGCPDIIMQPDFLAEIRPA